jgi:membrane-associated phospholipid phosphatase
VLSDAFANPLAASALITGREATVDPQAIARYTLAEPDYNATSLERWEPWVRMSVALQSLCSRMRYQTSGTGTAADPRAVALFDRGLANGATETKIVRLTAPLPEAFEHQLCLVLRWAELREERMAEVLSQLENQTAMVSSVPYLHPARTPRTLELLAVALQFAVAVEMRFKHELACWRPVEYSPHVQPMITTPGHGSLPSGHATQAYIVAEVLSRLLGIDPTTHPAGVQLHRQAARIATNRVIAGVHFPVDSIAGRMLGVMLGRYFWRCALATNDTWCSGGFDGTQGDFGTQDVELNPEVQSIDDPGRRPVFYTLPDEKVPIVADDVLVALRVKAEEEWRNRPFSPTAACRP